MELDSVIFCKRCPNIINVLSLTKILGINEWCMYCEPSNNLSDQIE